jgi:hypothetical protein
MKPATFLLAATAGMLLAPPALAFRCGSKLVREGDPQAKVLKICGQPVSTSRSTVYRSGIPVARETLAVSNGESRLTVTEDELLLHERSVVEVQVEQWTYNFGPHRLMRVVRFEDGVVAGTSQTGYGYLDD